MVFDFKMLTKLLYQWINFYKKASLMGLMVKIAIELFPSNSLFTLPLTRFGPLAFRQLVIWNTTHLAIVDITM